MVGLCQVCVHTPAQKNMKQRMDHRRTINYWCHHYYCAKPKLGSAKHKMWDDGSALFMPRSKPPSSMLTWNIYRSMYAHRYIEYIYNKALIGIGCTLIIGCCRMVDLWSNTKLSCLDAKHSPISARPLQCWGIVFANCWALRLMHPQHWRGRA